MRVLLFAILLIISAASASAAAIVGDITAAEGTTYAGALTIEATRVAIDLTPAVRAGEPLTLSFAEGIGRAVTRTWTFAGTSPSSEVSAGPPDTTNVSSPFPAGQLSGLACAENCRVLLYSDGPSGTLTIEGNSAGPLTWATPGVTFYSGARNPGVPDSFYYEVTPGALTVKSRSAGASDGLLDGTRISTSGTFTLFFANATAIFTDSTGERTVDAVSRSTPLVAPGGVVYGRELRVPFLHVRLTDVAIALPAETRAVTYATSPTLSLDGRFATSAAVGTLTIDGDSRQLAGESLAIDGTLATRPTLQDGGIALGAPREQGTHVTFEGKADQVTIAGAPLVQPASSIPLVGAAVGVTALFALIAAAGKWLGAAPFYTRVAKSTIFDNPNRRAVYEHIKGTPGATVADLIRSTGITEIVIRHHIHMLEQHGYVASRTSGRLRTYFSRSHLSDASLVDTHLVLKDDTRRILATSLAGNPAGLSQKELAEAVGVSLRLVSYHMARLETEGLIRVVGSMPRRYQATAILQTYVDQHMEAFAT